MFKVVVFGATGQLGAYTAEALKSCGFDVIAVGRRTSDNGFFKSIGVEYIGGISLENTTDFKKLPTINVDGVVNMAGAMPAHADASPMQYVQSIIVGNVNICEWMKKNKIQRIVFNTTPADIAHHFEKGYPVSENADRSFPNNGGDHASYAIAKNTVVDLLDVFRREYGLRPCVFRHLTVYGWHPNAYYHLNGIKKILPFRSIIRQCIAGKNIEVWGDPAVKKELLYIKDFTKAIVLAIQSDVCGLFNLPGVRPYTLEEQIDGIIRAFSETSQKIYCPDKPSTPFNLLQIGGARDLLHWTPTWDWDSACMDMKNDMILNPFKLLWGDAEKEDMFYR